MKDFGTSKFQINVNFLNCEERPKRLFYKPAAGGELVVFCDAVIIHTIFD